MMTEATAIKNLKESIKVELRLAKAKHKMAKAQDALHAAQKEYLKADFERQKIRGY
jgi:hypothetical protein